MTTYISVHGLAREVFDSLPGDPVPLSSGHLVKNLRLTNAFTLDVFCDEADQDRYGKQILAGAARQAGQAEAIS